MPEFVETAPDDLALAEDIFAVAVDDGLVLVREGLNCLFALNVSGQFMWERYAEGLSPGDVARETAAAFGIPEKQARADYEQALQDWRARGLLGPMPELPVHDPFVQLIPLENASPCHPPDSSQASVRHYRFRDVPFTVRFASAELERELAPRYAHLAASRDAQGALFDVACFGAEWYSLFVDGKETLRGTSIEAVRGGLFNAIGELAFPEVDPAANIHAAVVANGDIAVAMPAQSGSGKSTLTAGLCHAGYGFVTDDRLLLDSATLRTPTMPNGICAKEGSWPILEARYPGLPDLPVTTVRGKKVRFIPPPVYASQAQTAPNRLVFAAYEPEQPAQSRELTVIEALARLAQAEIWFAPEPEKIARFAGWVQSIPRFECAYTNLEEGVAMLGAYLQP